MSARALAVVLVVAVWVGACENTPTEPCTYTLSSTSHSVSAQGGTGSITVTTGNACGWTARAEVSWVTITGSASGTGSGAVSFAVSANPGTTARTGAMTIAGQSVSVNQAGGAPCAYSLSPASRAFGAAGGPGSVDVTTGANCSWTAASAAAWLTVVSGAQGTGNGTVAYQVAVNDAAGSRSASIGVADQTHTVSQTGTSGCSYSIDPDDEPFGASGGSGTTRVSAPAGCPWTARSNVAWIRVTAPADGQGVGSQTVSYAVDANLGDDARTGTISIGDKSLVVTQAGAKLCEYSVSPTAVSRCMAGWEGTLDVSTQTACSWTANVRSTDTWITLVSGQSGWGPGTIRYRVANNDEAPPREGTIEVRWPTPTAGQNVRVSQGGCSYITSPAALYFSATGGAGSFDVWTMPTPVECGGPLQDRCVWTVRSNVSWITITSSATMNGDGQVRFTVASYAGPQERVGTITAGGKTVYVYQRP